MTYHAGGRVGSQTVRAGGRAGSSGSTLSPQGIHSFIGRRLPHVPRRYGAIHPGALAITDAFDDADRVSQPYTNPVDDPLRHAIALRERFAHGLADTDRLANRVKHVDTLITRLSECLFNAVAIRLVDHVEHFEPHAFSVAVFHCFANYVELFAPLADRIAGRHI